MILRVYGTGFLCNVTAIPQFVKKVLAKLPENMQEWIIVCLRYLKRCVMGVFDIGDAREFFLSIKGTYDRSREIKVKSTEDVLYVIMGLNHLREWIVPGFDKIKGEWPVADTPEKEFSKCVYESREHNIIRNISNMTKHFKPKAMQDRCSIRGID